MILGIDLGTTNSSIAIWANGVVQIIPNVLGSFLTPSVISIDEGMVLVGEPALKRLVTYPDLTVANFKRYMGSNQTIKLGTYCFRAEELSALVLKQLKEDAEKFLGHCIHEAIISVPAYFSDAQRKATKIAAELAGLKIERLINEPTAAGIAYGLQENMEDSYYLIFDLGGGTFDVSILNMFSNIIEVNASCGDNLLGGIDFTRILEEMFLEQLCKEHSMDIKKIPSGLLNKITEQADLAKHKLSLDDIISMKIHWLEQCFEYDFNYYDFEKRIEPLLQRLKKPVQKILNDAKLSASQIEQIVLVGGASRMKAIKSLIARMFSKLPLCHIDPELVIVKGVAIAAGLKADDKDLQEFVVTDVCPYSLGISVSNDEDIIHFDPIIERNMVIPLSRSRIYYPARKKQRSVDIDIYQGESFFVDKNVLLGRFSVALPQNLKDSAFEVRFTYDINGLLEVEMTILETHEKKNIVIEGNPGLLTTVEIAQRLKEFSKLKIHPREQIENKLVLAQAERIFEELQGESRTQISNLIKDFIRALNVADSKQILREREYLKSVLNHFAEELNFL